MTAVGKQLLTKVHMEHGHLTTMMCARAFVCQLHINYTVTHTLHDD